MTEPRARKPGLLVPALVGAILGIAALAGAIVLARIQDQRAVDNVAEGWTLSSQQVQQVAAAVSEYDRQNSQRPESINMLVDKGLLNRSALTHDTNPTGHGEPAIAYFSAIQVDDPPQMVLLCTMLPHEKDRFHLVRNDGSYSSVSGAELAQAIQATYDYIDTQLRTGNPPASIMRR